MQLFIQQANQFGQARRPFFFLIDFEQQQPRLFPLDQLPPNVYFSVGGFQHLPPEIPLPAEPAQLSIKPTDFADYAQAFHIVQKGLQHGDSYLLNLTATSAIQTNYNLQQIFQRATAPYKMLWQDKFVCFSPESFIQIRDDRIFTYPMKGTIDAAQPNAAQCLLQDEKEQREHYTIVDLMRNDLAIVARDVQVNRFRYVENIQTERGEILQTSSEISGKLTALWRHQIGNILATLLPAGSISGAPKASTVDIIRKAEQQPRGYYSGVFGVFTGDELLSAVAIRFIEQQGQQLFFRSGGGVTIHSQAEMEYQELLQKVYLPFAD